MKLLEVLSRCAAGLLFLFFAAMFFGEGPPPAHEMLNLLWLSVLALWGGLGAAVVFPRAGGLVSLAGALGFWLITGRHQLGFFPIAVAALNVVSGELAHRWPASLPRAAMRAIVGAVTIFAVLCANEIFGNPPLMTPSVAGFAGRWAGPAGELNVMPDGAAHGTINGVALTNARVSGNRTWLGRALHLRTDAIVVSDQLRIPFVMINGRMEGSAFAAHGATPRGPAPVILTRAE